VEAYLDSVKEDHDPVPEPAVPTLTVADTVRLWPA